MPPAHDGATAESGGRGPEDGGERASPDESAGETTEGAVEPAQSRLCEDTCNAHRHSSTLPLAMFIDCI